MKLVGTGISHYANKLTLAGLAWKRKHSYPEFWGLMVTLKSQVCNYSLFLCRAREREAAGDEHRLEREIRSSQKREEMGSCFLLLKKRSCCSPKKRETGID
jgi:hypothetical protein